MHRIFPSLFVVVLAAMNAPTTAFAQEGGSDLRIGAGMVLDFGGEADYDWPGRRDPWLRDDDLEATIGLRAHLDYDLAKYLSIGGFVRLSWWEGEDTFEERSMMFDLGPRIAGHYDWRDFRFYLAGMPGLVISRVNDDNDVYDDWLDNPGLGFTMSIAPGMEYWFNNDIAVYVEFLGWVGHYFDHDFDRFDGDLDFDLNQVAFNFGVVFAP